MDGATQGSRLSKTCLGCGVETGLEAFNFRSKKAGRRQERCRDCTRAWIKQHYENNRSYYAKKARARQRRLKVEQRARMLAYLSEHPCVECGESDPVCLEFDHVRGRKLEAISTMVGRYEWAAIEKELAKCEVRCANCHRRKTARQRGYYRLLLEGSVRP